MLQQGCGGRVVEERRGADVDVERAQVGGDRVSLTTGDAGDGQLAR